MATTTTTRTRSQPLLQLSQLFWNAPVLWMSLLLFLSVLPARPEMASIANVELLLLGTALLAVLAIGQTVVLITAGIDLSMPAVISLTSVLGATLATTTSQLLGDGPAVALASMVMVCVGALIGAVHGLAVGVFRMPAFLVTLASLIGLGGTAVWVTQSGRTTVSEQFVELWYGRLMGIPLPLFWASILAVAAYYLLARTVAGRWLYAIGHSPETARISGVPLVGTTVLAYSISGFCAAFASVLYTARLYTGSPQLVENEVLLDCIGAAVIGGTSLFGGRGRITGTLLGAFFIALLGNSLNMIGLRYWHVITVKGLFILLAAILDVARNRFRQGA